MNEKTTELVFILDKSGSMEGLEKDTIGGFNAMIEKQKAVEGKVYVSTVLFSNYSEVLHDRKTIDEIIPLTQRDYQVGGCTALLDAVGNAIKHISNIHKYIREEDVPARTMFVITTDGMENASKEYSYDQVKDMICEREKCGWKFLFLADNIDAAKTAESIGIRRNRAVNYDSRERTGVMYEVLSDALRMSMKTNCGEFFEEMEAKIKNK